MKKSKKCTYRSVVMVLGWFSGSAYKVLLAVVNLKNPGKVVEIIPNVFEFRYLENQSAAIWNRFIIHHPKEYSNFHIGQTIRRLFESKNDIFSL